jgi:hypothetical protein
MSHIDIYNNCTIILVEKLQMAYKQRQLHHVNLAGQSNTFRIYIAHNPSFSILRMYLPYLGLPVSDLSHLKRQKQDNDLFILNPADRYNKFLYPQSFNCIK